MDRYNVLASRHTPVNRRRDSSQGVCHFEAIRHSDYLRAENRGEATQTKSGVEKSKIRQ